ncbi:HpcH/HpaI aldolase/citrate lyase family protein [Rubrivivax rivuli]|uniref:CoA ester lyase n=1 Tax=Rubrivivax rivuli TaxID=1862385 RepID=A0A437RAL3_9BURK|nr:aldolase/citrate lyase family protein [Rubrivivax rivuli]RVU43783.1 CoA ester lyase [Rubrivivax rivuli]
MSPTPVLPRSYLFVPGDRPERFAKALASGADAVVLDLEDAVAPSVKAAARAAAAQALASGDPRWVLRLNDAASPEFAFDLALLQAVPAPALMLPKAEDAGVIARLHAACPQAALLPLVESARGVLAAGALAAAPGVQRLVFGTLDYALDLGLEGPLAGSLGLDLPAALLALASRAAGIGAPVAGVTPALDDEAQLRADFDRARALGYTAKLCIDPRQVAPVHALLQPSAEEQAWAQRVVQAAEAAHATGAVQLDGRMVDRPVIERARRLLARTVP